MGFVEAIVYFAWFWLISLIVIFLENVNFDDYVNDGVM